MILTSLDFGIQIITYINNYNPVIIQAWQAKLDLQSVLNYYKAVSCAYFSESETETSQALIQTS